MFNSVCKTLPRLALASLGLLLTHSAAQAVTFSVSGLVGGASVAASADFSTSSNQLLLTLTNTTSGGTPTKSQVLTGLFFTVNGADPALSLPSDGAALGSGSALYTTAALSSTSADINGSYLFLSHPGGVLSSSFPYEYGLGSAGAGGLFPAGQFTKGGGGDDYAIVASGTNLSQSSFGSQFPYEMNSVQFTLNGLGTLGVDKITNVAFMFGSDGTNVLAGHSDPNVPEPGAFSWLCASSIPAAMLPLRRRFRHR